MAMRAPTSTIGVCFAAFVSIHMPVPESTCQTANLSGERRSPFVSSAMLPSAPMWASAARGIFAFRSVALMPSDLPDSTTDAIALPRTNRPSYAE